MIDGNGFSFGEDRRMSTTLPAADACEIAAAGRRHRH
jgi:hypothetical protein